MYKILMGTLLVLLMACGNGKEDKKPSDAADVALVEVRDMSRDTVDVVQEPQMTLQDSVALLFDKAPEYVAHHFDYPVGKPNANGYYNAQIFGENMHLGEDWNAVTGGNSDLGDPIYAVANGYVNTAVDYEGGWGKVVRIWHQLPDGKLVESLYAHCDEMKVSANSYVKKGQQIGTIGNVGGLYWAHLHLEIRDDITLPLGGGYDTDTSGYLDPTAFIKSHR